MYELCKKKEKSLFFPYRNFFHLEKKDLFNMKNSDINLVKAKKRKISFLLLFRDDMLGENIEW